MKRFFFDYDGDLRFWVWMALFLFFCFLLPTVGIYQANKYECQAVYPEQTGRNTQWRYGTCWVEMNGKFIPRKEIRMTEIN